MKKNELITMLKEIEGDPEIILQKDSESNGYSPLSGVDGDTLYIPDNTWSGDVYSTNWSAEDADMEEDEWDELLEKERCVVLFPIN